MKRISNRTVAQKLQVLEEAKQIGIAAACRKHGVANSVFYRWRERFEASGQLEAAPPGGRTEEGRQILELEAENLRLRRIVADKELELQIQRDLLKKKSRA